jgi:hypothetical protein
MKRRVALTILILTIALITGSALSFAQGTFSIPFKFKVAGKTLPSGEYTLLLKEDGQLALKKEGGEEVLFPFQERLPKPDTPLAEPALVFDVVGNFEPSYTEYVTEYVLAQIWVPGEQGYLIHLTKGAHQEKVIKGRPPAK